MASSWRGWTPGDSNQGGLRKEASSQGEAGRKNLQKQVIAVWGLICNNYSWEMQLWGQRRSQSIKHRPPAICSAFCWRTDAPPELSTRFGSTSTSETRKWHSHFSCNMLIRLRNCCCKQVPYPANGGDKYQICRSESPVTHVQPQNPPRAGNSIKSTSLVLTGSQLRINLSWWIWE